jgi:hypothetical protein
VVGLEALLAEDLGEERLEQALVELVVHLGVDVVVLENNFSEKNGVLHNTVLCRKLTITLVFKKMAIFSYQKLIRTLTPEVTLMNQFRPKCHENIDFGRKVLQGIYN